MKTPTQNQVGKFRKSTVLVGLAVALNLLAGCSVMPDSTLTTSSVSQVGYPGVSLARKKPAQSRKVIKKASFKPAGRSYLGRAPYICTPSGFGKTSRCFLRG
ncbi:hypothetical protein [Paramesorhizobium deserti]|uniref:hypothetical protein n=1 Tax=Paramesorhizobium deserti TaxID=1494590 RepID=UPI000A653635|nr:hypothetical protein [Paramesorhizobium deserti]